MRKSLLLLLLFPLLGWTQVSDDFSDGDFTNNPTWSGTDDKYLVNTNLQLQLNAEEAGTAYLSLPITEFQEMEWRFWIRENFAPSGNNYSDVFLSADNADLTAVTQGYFLRFGEGGSSDAIELFRKDTDGNHSICRGTEGAIAASFAVFVKVNCDREGNWTLQTCHDNSGNYVTEAQGVDDTFSHNGYFGFVSTFTASNAKKIFFDDVYVGPKIVDNEPPTLISTNVVDTKNIQLVFSEILDEVKALDAGNYTLDNGGGHPVSVTWGENQAIVNLLFANEFANGVNYTLTIQNLADLAGNVMETAQTSFSLYSASENDVVINEIMADPSPVVGLPEWEFVELFNTTDLAIDLKDWTLTISSTTKVFDNCTIAPNGYLIVCHVNAVDEFSAFGSVCGLLTSSTAITNGGTSLRLADKNSNLISEVTFDISWYHDTSKDDGGWTLEQISPNNPCAGGNNWAASVNEVGGTPGAQNSIFDPTSAVPKIAKVEVCSADSLLVYFDQTMNQQSIENVNVYQIMESNQHPQNVGYVDSLDCVWLKFNPALQEGVTLTLKVANSAVNCIGTPVGDNETVSFVISKEAAEYDVVINEIMADPTPAVGLPEWEYIELYNTTDYVINLEGWQIQVGANDNVFGNVILAPHAYLIVCHNDAVDELKTFGDCVGFGSFAIGNTGSTIILIGKNGQMISRADFSNSWYHDADKKDGGWSVEQIDPMNPCAAASNWTASVDALGGTPGSINSVNGQNESQPKVERISMFSNYIVQLWFDQQMNPATLMDVNHFYVDEIGEHPTYANINPMDATFVELEFDYGFEEGVIYSLIINDVENCIGNKIEPDTKMQFGIPNEITKGEILINEIMFDPIAPGVDYVELYNHSDKTFDLSNLMLGVIKETFPNPADTTLKEIAADSRLFLPGTYALLSTNSQIVGEQYGCSTENFVEMASFPNYANAGGTAILMSKDGTMIDQMYFTEKMHYPLIKVTKGVALERVSFDIPSDDVNNWHSAAESVHFGTPGYANSMMQNVDSSDDAISVSPEVFSPDGDGFDDDCFVSYHFDKAGYTMNVYIFNVAGQLVKHLAKGELVGQEGSMIWNGTDNHNNRVPVGVYVVVTEVFNFDGVVKKYKNAVVVATR